MRGTLIVAILFSCIVVSATIGFIFAVGSDDVSQYGNTLYVDDSGGADYVRIQDAINDASDGDTVFVYSGTYFENLVVDKSINLIGEDKNTTVIDGRQLDDTVWIKTSSVRLSGFSIVNSSELCKGIQVIEKFRWTPSDPIHTLSNIVISDCIIKNNDCGVRLMITRLVDIVNCEFIHNYGVSILMMESSNVNIRNCLIYGNGREDGNYSATPGGIILTDIPDREDSSCKNIVIHNCSIFDNVWAGVMVDDYVTNVEIRHNKICGHSSNGISIDRSSAFVHDNIIVDNGGKDWADGGIYVQDCRDDVVTIRRNVIESNHRYGIYLLRSTKILIMENNFINNTCNGFFKVYFSQFALSNKWDRNYWDDWRGWGPKIIFGRKVCKPQFPWFLRFPWFSFDWNPAKEPYVIME
jgi:parallel beta-helix repeat protein